MSAFVGVLVGAVLVMLAIAVPFIEGETRCERDNNVYDCKMIIQFEPVKP